MSIFRNLISYENQSIFPRQDELILKMLWEAIASFAYNKFKLTDTHLIALQQEEGSLYTQGGGVYWSDSDSEKKQFISDDYEMLNAVDAFNALRGKQQLINTDY